MTENELAKEIVDAAYRIHTTLGPGLLETVYGLTLAWELEKRGLRVARQPEVPVVYQGTRIEAGFRADLIVEDQSDRGSEIRRGPGARAQKTAPHVPASG
jgi:GxxExxY protein